MAKFNNIDAPIGSVSELTSNNLYAQTVSSREYSGLPIASLINSGIVKIDGTSITIDEFGVISAHLVFDNESMEAHIENNNIHILPEDRNNLAILNSHISSTSIHFGFKEKETMQSDIKIAKDHITTPHLSGEETSYLKTHVLESWMHFDNATQKNNLLNFINNFPLVTLTTPDRFLITDATGKTKLSTMPATVLNYLPNLQVPLVDYLAEYFQGKGSVNPVDLSDIHSHMQNTEVHMTQQEKDNLNNEIELLKLDKGETLFAKKEDLIGFADDEHTHTSLEMTHNSRNLYAILTEVLSDIGAMKADIATIKGDIGTVKSDMTTAKSDIGTLKSSMTTVKNDISIAKSDITTLKNDSATFKNDIATIKNDIISINEKIELYHQTTPDEILPVE